MNKVVVERVVKEYFKNLKELKDQEDKLVEIKSKLVEYKEMLKGANLKFYVDLGCQKYVDDIQGQGGKPTSKVEQELEKRYRQIENYLEYYIRHESHTLDRIHNLNIDIEPVRGAMKELSPLELEVITRKYKEKESVKAISHKLFGGVEKTVYRINKKAFEKMEDNIKVSDVCPKVVREMSESCQIS